MDVFHSLVIEDVSFIVSADSVLDDCPCPEILNDYDRTHTFIDSYEFNLSHGILWLYCDESKSIQYLKKALEDSPNKEKLKASIKAIKKYYKSVQAN